MNFTIGLKDEVDQHVNWILGNSTVPQIRRGSYRRVNLKIFPYISLTLFVKIPYGFLLLHMVIVNPNTGLKEKTESANKLFERTRKTAQLKSDIIRVKQGILK